MDKLLSVAEGVGQPLRPEDWAFLQNAEREALKSILMGLNTNLCVLHGLEVAIVGSNIEISDGVIFDGDELCYVPSAIFEYHGETLGDLMVGTGDWLLYLSQDISTGENRTFKDASTHDVWQYRRYAIGYAETVPTGDLQFNTIKRLIDLISNYVADHLPPAATGVDIKERKKVFTSDELDQVQILVPAPGAGKVIQVLSISCKNTVTTPLDAGSQMLNVTYGDDPTTFAVGRFPNTFLESLTTSVCECTYVQNRQEENMNLVAAYSGETRPSAGSSTFTFIVIYKIIEY